MSLLYFLSYLAILFQICFVTISFAAGLYYLSELVEEYSEKTKKVISWLAKTTVLLYLIFTVTENFSWLMIGCGLTAQILHLLILRTFPDVRILSFEFIGAVLMLLTNHYLAYKHFQEVFYTLSEVSILHIRPLNSYSHTILPTDPRLFYIVPLARSIFPFC